MIFALLLVCYACYINFMIWLNEGKMPKDKVWIEHIHKINNNESLVKLTKDVLVYDSYKICEIWYRDITGHLASIQCPDSVFDLFQTMVHYSVDFPKMAQRDDYLNIKAYIPTEDLKLLILKECNKRLENAEQEMSNGQK